MHGIVCRIICLCSIKKNAMQWFDRSLRAQSCVVSEYRCFDIIVEPTRGSANDAGLEIITSVTKFRTTDLKHSAVCHVSKV